MKTRTVSAIRFIAVGLFVSGILAACWADAASQTAASQDSRAWFQKTEQSLMDAFGTGDKRPWESVMDPGCVITSEEGQVMTRENFLADLRGLPKGLSGGITVEDLTVQEFPGLAIVRFMANEWETVFAQRLTTRYRITDVFRQVGGSWKMVSSHTSVVTQDPPEQKVSHAGWPALVGRYEVSPGGWVLTVELRGDALYGGRDPKNLRRFIALTPDVFVLSGSLGEWIFVTDPRGRATQIVDFRKFEPLIWHRIAD